MLNREQQYRQNWDELLEAMPLAKVFFGEPAASILDGFWKVRNKVVAAASSYGRCNASDGLRSQRYELIFWSGGDENDVDAIADELSSLKEQAERLLLPILRHEYVSVNERQIDYED